MKTKAMISQPMAGKTENEIKETRDRFLEWAKQNDYDVVNTLFTDEWYSSEKMKERGVKKIPLCFFAKAVENMSLCDVVYFAKGWENARGCVCEHAVAVAYGLEVVFE